MSFNFKEQIKPWLTPVLVGIIALGIIIYFAVPAIFGAKVNAYALKRGELIQTVVASGRVETPARVDVGSQVTGRVLQVPVKEGQVVKAGDLLIELDNADERAALALAEAAVRQAEVKLKQYQEQIQPIAEQNLQQAQANLLNLQKQFERSNELVKQGFIGKAQLDDAQRNLDVARSQVRSAQLQLQGAKPNGGDYQLASAALEQARAAQRSAQAKLDRTRITAVADGVLITRDVERGDIVQPGKILLTLSPVGVTQLLVQIDEKNLRYLKLGQKALAVTDAYPGQHFPAQVVFINPGVNALRGSVDVKLNVDQPPAFLQQDMTVSVEIEVARRADALTLNVEAIHEAVSAHPWVQVVNQGKVERREIKLGVAGDSSVEVISGLHVDDLVLPATGVQIAEGKRVRPEVIAKK